MCFFQLYQKKIIFLMPKIRILPEETINQIAAGEVIENPSSVIKELIENAIDAHATSIHVETLKSGRNLIVVSDDGMGMNQEDLILSVERHATSKIRSSFDLHSLNTLGFRGEALASVASVSKMKITSAETGMIGHTLLLEGGKALSLQPTARQQGTTVEVASLFYNVPVRKHFQRSLQADFNEIYKLMVKMGLCFPHLKLSWSEQGIQQFLVSGQEELKYRIYSLLGESVSDQMVPLICENENILFRGFISQPTLHRPNKTGQYLFINHRSVQCPRISESILKGYGPRLPEHRYPLFILMGQLLGEEVDVNVHPQKKEIRLRREEKIEETLMMAVDCTLQQRFYASNSTPVRFDSVLETCALFAEDGDSEVDSAAFLMEEASLVLPENVPLHQIPIPFDQHLKILCAAGGYYFIEHNCGRIYLFDAKAARSSLLFERWKKKASKPLSEPLLLPITLELPRVDYLFLEERKELLEEIGFSLRSFGGSSFLIDGLPEGLERSKVEEVIKIFLEDVSSKKWTLERFLKKISKIAAQCVSSEETLLLANYYFEGSLMKECPFGCPICIEMTELTLKKIFRMDLGTI
jgi:DNA mismatch repair protein MutL